VPVQKTILVVDDDERVRSLLQEALAGAGYRALVADGGPEALRKLAAEEVDAVITDVRMPEWDGLTLLERIKEQWPTLPVIMITAYADEQIREGAEARGAEGFLSKPFRLDQLRNLLTEVMRKAAGRRIETVLVVEDDDEFRQILMEILPALGYTAQSAPTGEAALAMVDRERFDAVITDYLLPGMTGTELLRKIKAVSPDTTVVLITGYAPSVDGYPFSEADGYLMKPFRFDEIDRLLKNLPSPLR